MAYYLAPVRMSTLTLKIAQGYPNFCEGKIGYKATQWGQAAHLSCHQSPTHAGIRLAPEMISLKLPALLRIQTQTCFFSADQNESEKHVSLSAYREETNLQEPKNSGYT